MCIRFWERAKSSSNKNSTNFCAILLMCLQMNSSRQLSKCLSKVSKSLSLVWQHIEISCSWRRINQQSRYSRIIIWKTSSRHFNWDVAVISIWCLNWCCFSILYPVWKAELNLCRRCRSENAKGNSSARPNSSNSCRSLSSQTTCRGVFSKTRTSSKTTVQCS